MMISMSTGVISFDDPAFRLTPNLQLDEFASSPEFVEFTKVVWNAGYAQYHLKSATANALRFAVRLLFFGQRLCEVGLCQILSGDKNGWGQWSEDRERNRHILHRDTLVALLPEQQPGVNDVFSFPWGDICTIYDNREHHTEIRVDYRATDRRIQ